MLDVSIIILLFIFVIYVGFLSKYNITQIKIVKIVIIIGIILLQFAVDKRAHLYMIVLGTMLVIPREIKECFKEDNEYKEDKEDKKDTKKSKKSKKSKDSDDKDDKDDKDTKKSKKSKKSKDSDDKDDKEGGFSLFKKKKSDDDDDDEDDDKETKDAKNKKKTAKLLNTIQPKCANQKIKLLIPDNINIETEKMMTCKTMSDTCFQLLDITKQNDMCSMTPKKSFFSTNRVEAIPANKKDMLTVDNCVAYLSKCIKDGDSVYPGEAVCKNVSMPESSDGK
jgi:hypothetical protein